MDSSQKEHWSRQGIIRKHCSSGNVRREITCWHQAEGSSGKARGPLRLVTASDYTVPLCAPTTQFSPIQHQHTVLITGLAPNILPILSGPAPHSMHVQAHHVHAKQTCTCLCFVRQNQRTQMISIFTQSNQFWLYFRSVVCKQGTMIQRFICSD